LDKKTFSWELDSWELSSYNLYKAVLKFTFDNPEFISVGAPDTMGIKYANNGLEVTPIDENKEDLANGDFFQTIKIES